MTDAYMRLSSCEGFGDFGLSKKSSASLTSEIAVSAFKGLRGNVGYGTRMEPVWKPYGQ